MTSSGNATDFGDLSNASEGPMAGGNSTRGIFAGSFSPVRDYIDYFTIASTGNATDFGDLTQSRGGGGGTSNSTRTIFMGGRGSDGAPYAGVNTIDYVTTASTGNATDYGDLTSIRRYTFNGLSDSHAGLT